MTMTKKDFQLIADTILDLDLDPEAKLKVANAFADKLAFTNPRFDRDKFVFECGAMVQNI